MAVGWLPDRYESDQCEAFLQSDWPRDVGGAFDWMNKEYVSGFHWECFKNWILVLVLYIYIYIYLFIYFHYFCCFLRGVARY